MVYTTAYYVAYLIVCTALIAGLARLLHAAGGVFLRDCFSNRAEMVRAVARLLDIGFYLVSLGYVAVTYRTDSQFSSIVDVTEAVIIKFGFFLIVLGFLHVFNLLILALFRARRDPAPPAAVS
ncbi:MAG: hypothetical protein WBG54_15885 [Acidobacteriaceae bacterium]